MSAALAFAWPAVPHRPPPRREFSEVELVTEQPEAAEVGSKRPKTDGFSMIFNDFHGFSMVFRMVFICFHVFYMVFMRFFMMFYEVLWAWWAVRGAVLGSGRVVGHPVGRARWRAGHGAVRG